LLGEFAREREAEEQAHRERVREAAEERRRQREERLRVERERMAEQEEQRRLDMDFINAQASSLFVLSLFLVLIKCKKNTNLKCIFFGRNLVQSIFD
jgi:hypothetical protein